MLLRAISPPAHACEGLQGSRYVVSLVNGQVNVVRGLPGAGHEVVRMPGQVGQVRTVVGPGGIEERDSDSGSVGEQQDDPDDAQGIRAFDVYAKYSSEHGGYSHDGAPIRVLEDRRSIIADAWQAAP